MAWTYSCPLCESVVNPDETVILLGALHDTSILMGFHPRPGNYTVYLPPGCDLRRGDRWELYCPVCRQSIASDAHENLAELLIWQGDVRRKVMFSRKVGERATYVVADEATVVVEEQHGEHAKNYEKTIPRFKISDLKK
jgi:hypothetical protein